MTDKKPILCLDFDGVIHAYTSGWQGIDKIPDGPVPGAIEFIQKAQEYFRVVVYSSRSENTNGINAMMRAISEWVWEKLGMPGRDVYSQLEFPRTKPSAFVTIDDRAVTFVGRWPDPAELRYFRPWNKCTSGEMQRTLAELTRPADLIEWASIPSTLSGEERIRLERCLGEFARAVQMTQRITDHKEAALYLQHASADIVGLVELASTRRYYDRAVEMARMAPPPALSVPAGTITGGPHPVPGEIVENRIVTPSAQISPVSVGDPVRQKVFAIVEDIQARGGNIDEAQDAADKIIELLRPAGGVPRLASGHFAETSPSVEPQVGQPYTRPTIGDPDHLTGPEWSRLEELSAHAADVDEERELVGPVTADWPSGSKLTVRIPTHICMAHGITPGRILHLHRRSSGDDRSHRYMVVTSISQLPSESVFELTGPVRSPRDMLTYLVDERTRYMFEFKG